MGFGRKRQDRHRDAMGPPPRPATPDIRIGCQGTSADFFHFEISLSRPSASMQERPLGPPPSGRFAIPRLKRGVWLAYACLERICMGRLLLASDQLSWSQQCFLDYRLHAPIIWSVEVQKPSDRLRMAQTIRRAQPKKHPDFACGGSKYDLARPETVRRLRRFAFCRRGPALF